MVESIGLVAKSSEMWGLKRMEKKKMTREEAEKMVYEMLKEAQAERERQLDKELQYLKIVNDVFEGNIKIVKAN